MPPREQPNPPSRRRRPEPMPGGWLWLVILLLLAGIMVFTLGNSGAGVIGFKEFMGLVKDGKIKEVVIRGNERMIGDLDKAAVEQLDEKIKKHVRYDKIE